MGFPPPLEKYYPVLHNVGDVLQQNQLLFWLGPFHMDTSLLESNMVVTTTGTPTITTITTTTTSSPSRDLNQVDNQAVPHSLHVSMPLWLYSLDLSRYFNEIEESIAISTATTVRELSLHIKNPEEYSRYTWTTPEQTNKEIDLLFMWIGEYQLSVKNQELHCMHPYYRKSMGYNCELLLLTGCSSGLGSINYLVMNIGMNVPTKIVIPGIVPTMWYFAISTRITRSTCKQIDPDSDRISDVSDRTIDVLVARSVTPRAYPLTNPNATHDDNVVDEKTATRTVNGKPPFTSLE